MVRIAKNLEEARMILSDYIAEERPMNLVEMTYLKRLLDSVHENAVPVCRWAEQRRQPSVDGFTNIRLQDLKHYVGIP